MALCPDRLRARGGASWPAGEKEGNRYYYFQHMALVTARMDSLGKH
jgi:hypothetical protein